MPQSLSNVLIHLVFSTKGRAPIIPREFSGELHAYIGSVLALQDTPSLQVGGMPDHLHVLARLSRTKSVAELVNVVKGTSTKWIRRRGGSHANFQWQNGYGAFSVSSSQMQVVINYIRNQERHHGRFCFQVEFLNMLRKHAVEWDDRYVWD